MRQAFGFLHSKKQPPHTILVFLLTVAFFTALLTVRAKMIHYFGVEIPYWDQWDGEVERLYFTYLNGSLGIHDFFLPANEHRIFYTRVLNLAVFIWHNNTLSTISTMLAQNWVITGAVAFTAYAFNHDRFRVLPTVFLFVAYALPLAPENQFWGYQSQVYFLIFFLVIASWLISSKKIPFIPIATTSILAAASMGSAFLIAAIAALRSGLTWLQDRSEMKHLYKAIGFLILSLILTQVIWHNPGHEAFQAKTIQEFLHRLNFWYSWPQQPYVYFGKISFTLFAVLLVVRSKMKTTFSRVEIFSLSLISFVFLLALIGSFSRGGVAVRYHDYILMALAGMVAWSTEMLSLSKNYFMKAGAIIVIGVIFCQIISLTPYSIVDARNLSLNQEKGRNQFMYALQLKPFGESAVRDFLGKSDQVLYPGNDVLIRIVMNPYAGQVFEKYK